MPAPLLDSRSLSKKSRHTARRAESDDKRDRLHDHAVAARDAQQQGPAGRRVVDDKAAAEPGGDVFGGGSGAEAHGGGFAVAAVAEPRGSGGP